MSALPNTIQHPASVDAYIRHGWSLVPIPVGTKGPRTPGWNLRENALKSQADLPPGYGIGLAHAYSGTMAFDIDNWDATKAQGIDLDALYSAPDAVVIDSGRQGHGKLLYAMPFGLALPSKKVIIDGVTVYELRCATSNGLTLQDVLPPSQHPQTLQPYRWAGRGHWTRLPTIPDQLLELWQQMLEQDKVRNISTTTPINASWSEIRSALEAITPDCSRDEWVNCGMAMHWAGSQTDQLDQALNLWNEWSMPSTKYPGEREIFKQWQSFKSDKATVVKLGTLFQIARQHGWQRPTPDASEFFKSVANEVKAPIQITDSLRPPPPNLDTTLFPRILNDAALEVSEGVGCDPLLPLFAGLSAICGAIDAQTRLELKPGFKVPPVLWVMTIGDPADKKSPGSKPMFQVLKAIQAEDHKRYSKDKLNYEALDAQYQSAKKAFIEHAQSADAMLTNSLPPALPPEPSEPVEVKIIVQDISSQKLVRQAAKRPRGLLCYLDEMSSWVDKLCDKRSGDDRSSWVVAYESDTYEMDRVGAGTIYCENYALSIFGNIQPEVYQANVENLTRDGLLQRFIPVPLRHNQTRKGHPVPKHMSLLPSYEQVVRSVYALPPLTYTLDDQAAHCFDAFQDWYEEIKQAERVVGSGPRYMTAFGKLEGLVGRLALVWHVIENPYCLQVSGDVMERAVTFIKHYLVPSLRYTFEHDLGGAETFDMWVADYILYHSDKAEMSLSEIKHGGRKQLGNMNIWQKDQAVLGAMKILEDARWVTRIDDGSKEHQHYAVWVVNPELRDRFKEDRADRIKKRQMLMDETRGYMRLDPKKVKYSELLEESIGP
jgi:hypothetical protein